MHFAILLHVCVLPKIPIPRSFYFQRIWFVVSKSSRHSVVFVKLRSPRVLTGKLENCKFKTRLNKKSGKNRKASHWLEATHLQTPWQLQRNRFRKRAASILIIIDKRNIYLTYSLKMETKIILEYFLVHKKDVFAESSLAHAVSWVPPLLFFFQCAL